MNLAAIPPTLAFDPDLSPADEPYTVRPVIKSARIPDPMDVLRSRVVLPDRDRAIAHAAQLSGQGFPVVVRDLRGMFVCCGRKAHAIARTSSAS